MKDTSTHNAVTFILDKGFFEELHRELAAVLEADGKLEDSYVLIAMWLCKLKTPLPAVRVGDRTLAPTTLDALLAKIAKKGHRVRFVLWNGSNPIVEPARTALWMGLKVVTLNYVAEPLGAGFLRFGGGSKVYADEIRMWCTRHPNTGAYLESYRPGYLSVGTSNHQKFVVCSTNRRLSALVGGFNINDKYSAEPAHGQAGEHWHDTAVLLRGPAAHAIQTEWLRRWNKQYYLPWSADTLPATLDDQQLDKKARSKAPNRRVTIATTNAEARPAEKDIRALVIERIQAAKDYIYFENYAFTDPEIIDALATRMAADKALRVMVVIHHPSSPLYSTDTLWSYLQYYTFILLAVSRFKQLRIERNQDDLTNDESFTLRPPSARNVNGEAVTNLGVQKSSLGWRLGWTDGHGQAQTALLTEVADIRGRHFMYGPRTTTAFNGAPQWPYPHSKLALFDDRYALVGSSNWTYRSMEYDGEITAMIDDGEKVAQIRDDLLSHWEGGLTVDNFEQRASANLEKVTGGQMPANRCFLVPLELGDFVRPDAATLKTKATMDAMWTWF